MYLAAILFAIDKCERRLERGNAVVQFFFRQRREDQNNVFDLFAAGEIVADEGLDGRFLRCGVVPDHGGQQASSHSVQVPIVPGWLKILANFYFLIMSSLVSPYSWTPDLW